MQSVYLNNRKFIDEVEVALYKLPFEMVYHDAVQIDKIKETPELLEKIHKQREVHFYLDDYQAVGMCYSYQGNEYLVTAATYDGYGYAHLHSLQEMLLILSIIGLTILFAVGYLLARSALSRLK